jgi:hypothetical protein
MTGRDVQLHFVSGFECNNKRDLCFSSVAWVSSFVLCMADIIGPSCPCFGTLFVVPSPSSSRTMSCLQAVNGCVGIRLKKSFESNRVKVLYWPFLMCRVHDEG